MPVSRPQTALCSMTGYAQSESLEEHLLIRAEARSLNHRFCEAKVRVPKNFQDLDHKIRSLIKSRLSRGVVDLRVDLQWNEDAPGSSPQANLALAAHYYECLCSIQKTLGLQGKVSIADLINFPDVIKKSGDDPDPEYMSRLGEKIFAVVNQTLDRLIQMRATEGEHLAQVIAEIIDQIQDQLKTIEGSREEWKAQLEKKTENRLKKFFEEQSSVEMANEEILKGRIAQEVAILLDRTDVEEELSRARGHLDHFREILKEKSPIGKKLEFMVQEINREFTTLSNKAQDQEISKQVVQCKVLIEQIREQVMNIE